MTICKPVPVRFFLSLFFMFLFSGICWASPNVAAAPVAPAPLEVRYPNAQKLKELRAGNEFQYGQDVRPDLSFWQRFWQRVGDFINRVLEAKSFQSVWKYVLYAFAIGITLFVVLKLFQVDFTGLFRRKAAPGALAYETYRENIHEIDFKTLIEEAEGQEDYRRALRLHYLSTLKHLTDRELIHWTPGKTNRSYVSELKNPSLKQPFSQITQLFEYVWYGGSALDATRFQTVRQSFQEFNRSLPTAA